MERFLRDRVTGAAWLSSARVVRCWVKSRNERNPCPYLPAGNAGNSKETAGDKPEEGGDDVKSSWPSRGGLQTCYNGWYRALRTREGELIAKSRSQFGLQAAGLRPALWDWLPLAGRQPSVPAIVARV